MDQSSIPRAPRTKAGLSQFTMISALDENFDNQRCFCPASDDGATTYDRDELFCSI